MATLSDSPSSGEQQEVASELHGLAGRGLEDFDAASVANPQAGEAAREGA